MLMPRRTAVASLVALALFLAACSADDGGESSSSSEPPATTDATGTTTTSAGPDAASVPPAPSAGCLEGGGALQSDSVEMITVRGEERAYQRHLPPAHDGTEPLPLVLDFHGYSEGAQIHALHSDLQSFGDQEDFVTITPQGQGPVPFWDVAVDSVDLEFVGRILDAEEAALCVDANRVYSTGLSNGAFMTSAVACVYEDRIAAAAPVAGIRDLEDCAFDRPVPVVAFHGTDDDFVSYTGGFGSAAADLPTADGSGETLAEAGEVPDGVAGAGSVPDLTAAWAARNGCDAEPEHEQVAEDVTLIRFACPPDATAELFRVDGGGHSWPGSEFSAQIEDVVGPTTFSIDANQIMWDFFLAHPLN